MSTEVAGHDLNFTNHYNETLAGGDTRVISVTKGAQAFNVTKIYSRMGWREQETEVKETGDEDREIWNILLKVGGTDGRPPKKRRGADSETLPQVL
jgi:hypothetical protein